MPSVRLSRFRVLGGLLLVGLLLVPVLASGHFHGTNRAMCATCAVTQHAPLVTAQGVAAAPGPLVAQTLLPATVTRPASPVVRVALGRGPPTRPLAVAF
jgi:hypothetical protein